MKKILLTLGLLLVFNYLSAQDYKFGKVSKQELEEQFYPSDSSANAAILYKKRKTFYRSVGSDIELITAFQYRIKIYNSDGFEWATKQIELRQSNSTDEDVGSLKAITYNLVDGKIEETKLNKNEVFNEEKNKFRQAKKFTMPNLKEGCVIEYQYEVRSPFFTTIDDVIIQYAIPVKKYEGTITLLEYFKFNKQSKGYFNFSVVKKSFNNQQLGTKDEQIEIAANNVPALEEESYVNNIDNYRAGMVFEVASLFIPGSVMETYASDWGAVTKSIYKSSSFGSELEKTSYLKDDAEILKAQCKTDSEKIVAALEFVKKKVKWNNYYGKYTQDGVRSAYKDGEGNCGEVNLILVTMLREIGLNANPILLSTRKNGVPILPTSDGLNYVIAGVELKDQVILLDATDPYSSPDILPLRTVNWRGRLVRERGSSTGIDLIPKKRSKTSTTISIVLTDEGESNGMLIEKYENMSALNFRTNYATTIDDDIISVLEKDNEGVEIESFRIQNKKDPYKTATVMCKFYAENSADVIGTKMYINPLLFESKTENPFTLEKRDYPIDFGTPFTEKISVSIIIPEGYKVISMPETIGIALPNNFGTYKYKVTISDNKISIRSQLDINTAVYPSVDYAAIKDFYSRIVTKNLEKIVIEKATL